MTILHNVFCKLRGKEIEIQKELRRRRSNPSGNSTPVFIVGCGRSGTSMLLMQLSKSWQVEHFNENHPAAFDNWRLREPSIVHRLIQDTYAPIVLFKPILNTSQTRELLSSFPKSKIVFCFRHYDDVINSSLKKFGRENRIGHVRSWISDDFAEFSFASPPEQTKIFIQSRWCPSLNPESGAALYWLFYNRLYFDLKLFEDERVKLIQYEKLVTNPVAVFTSLCQFLGLEFEFHIVEGIFASSVRRDDPPDIDPGIRADCEELWRRLCRHATL